MEDEIIMEEDEDSGFNWEIKPPYHKFVFGVIKSIGWYIVAIFVVLIYTWPRVKKILKSWKKKRDDMEYDVKYHKDVEFNTQRLIATQQARERMQEKYLRDREIALQKEEEKRERKRQEMLLSYNQSCGYPLTDGSSSDDPTPSTSKPKLKPDFNPLMGAGTSGRYIPPRRSRCGNGGCG